ncbi:MAG TPA: 16S rRNA (cytosine(1402)-N(4))-methyltransferase RsmH [Chitinispirillaceae bacterium]|jgi:16S rRNA (cytosine1402-N4)-methyltransferase|nr:16S rRNA (cytosine(1402)-N(4))-methyltransferase RsmH [Chitinispirillaceae bacterium]
MNREFYHEPVLRDEVTGLLVTRKDGVYVDCTMGGGGHFRALAEKLDSNATLIGIDRDIDAVNWNKSHAVKSDAAQIIEQERFSQFNKVLDKHDIGAVDGFLLDLGLSSFQIDSTERGFSYMRDSELDMRMSADDETTAASLLERMSEEELSDILSRYGEIRNPSRMARAIKSCPELKTSSDLRECLSREYGHLDVKIIARVFQSLRIAVNDELGELRRFLDKVAGFLRAGGRLAVIAYHSLEDRMVKEFMREQEQSCICPPGLPVCKCNKPVLLKRITKGAVKPSEEEIRRNPRSRSARLRVAERTAVAL